MAILKDELQQNPGTFSGSPTLIPSLLPRDTVDQATSFRSGASFSIPDSPALSLPIVVGGAAFEFTFTVPSLPGAEGTIIEKAGSYGVYLRADGKIRFHLVNGASSVDLISTGAVTAGQRVHLACVYNGGYTGAPKLGHAAAGADISQGVRADYRAGALTGDPNLEVSRYQALERCLLTAVEIDLVWNSGSPYTQDMAAVVYRDSSGQPGAKAAQSAGVYVGSEWATRAFRPFDISADGVIVDENEWIWIGIAGGAVHTSEFTVFFRGQDDSGGARRMKNSVVSAGGAGPADQPVADPFGAASTSDAVALAVYCDYTPLGRTGDEGNVLIYLNGQEDSRAAYTAGIADSANPLTGPTINIDLDDLSIWNKKLDAVQVAKHYAAR